MGSKGIVTGQETVRFERTLMGPIARVWDHLTDSRHLPVWFGSEGMEFAIEPRMGGNVSLMGGQITGVVKEWQPPTQLAYSWNLTGVPAPETVVTFDLSEAGGGVRLALTHGPIGTGFKAATLSGWHTFLDRLEAMLGCEDPGEVMAAMQTHRDAYLADYPEG